MVDHVAYQFALRAKLVALSVATTGVMSLSATSTGYARASGSFLADGFDIGMEVVPSGFATNTARIITGVSALALTVSGTVTVETAAGGRSLAVGLPSSRAWENMDFEPTAGIPWVEEEYIPGPSAQVTLGPLGEIEVTPMYSPKVHVRAGTGMTASRYGDAVIRLFAPRTAIALTNGDVLRVRADTAPLPSQVLQSRPGFAMKSVNIPLRIRTNNVI